jgi:hypothetical protein
MPSPVKLLTNLVHLTAPIYWQLLRHPELWNEHTARTEHPDSPHHGLDDIWVRFAEVDKAFDYTKPAPDKLHIAEHESVWYPSAEVLKVHNVCQTLMNALGSTELGGVLITRIPPGKMCLPHTDLGWHANEYIKVAVQLTSAPGQKFCFEEEELESRPGDVYVFDNSKLHWVINPTDYERVTMIVCLKRGDD